MHTDGVTEARDAPRALLSAGPAGPGAGEGPAGAAARGVAGPAGLLTEGGPRDDVAVLVLSAAGAGAAPK
ncbi:hypothetical protein ACFSNO_28535 [Streptomyces cirratus]